MEQDSKRITNRRNFLMSFGAAAGVALYPETLSFAQASGAGYANSYDSSGTRPEGIALRRGGAHTCAGAWKHIPA